MSGAAAAPITEAFMLRHTVRTAPPLVPELRLHLAAEFTPLWEATEAELERLGLPSPFWAFAWAGGQALARNVIDNAPLVAGRRILDLGAGSGIAGLAALWASAAAVIANDTDPVAGIAVRLNAEENGLLGGLTVENRDMLEEPVLAADGEPLFDTVLAGDILYERTTATRVRDWLQRHADAGALVLIGDPGRGLQPADGLDLQAQYDIPVPRCLEDAETRQTSVWRLKPAAR